MPHYSYAAILFTGQPRTVAVGVMARCSLSIQTEQVLPICIVSRQEDIIPLACTRTGMGRILLPVWCCRAALSTGRQRQVGFQVRAQYSCSPPMAPGSLTFIVL